MIQGNFDEQFTSGREEIVGQTLQSTDADVFAEGFDEPLRFGILIPDGEMRTQTAPLASFC